MSNIDKRAQEYAKKICPNNKVRQIIRSTAYSIGAYDERRELIEKACRFFHEHFWVHPHTNLICAEWDGSEDEFVDMLIKKMEE